MEKKNGLKSAQAQNFKYEANRLRKYLNGLS